MFPRTAIVVAGLLVIGVVLAIRMSEPVRLAEDMRARMAVGTKYMKSLTDRDIPPWIERTKHLLSEWAPELHPIGAYGLGGKPVPADLQQLGILRIDILQDQVRYVWLGGMDHTELEVDRVADGTFRFIAHYNDYKSEVIWPKRPNQAMELTASRRFTQLCMISTRQFVATRAFARGSSSCSR